MFRFFMLTAIVLAMTLPTAAQINRDCVFPERLHDFVSDGAIVTVALVFEFYDTDRAFISYFAPRLNENGYISHWEFHSVNTTSEDGELTTFFEPQRKVDGVYLTDLYEENFRLEFCHYARLMGANSELDDG